MREATATAVASVETTFCECGCGQPVTAGRRYRLGHASRVRWAGHKPVPVRHGTLNAYTKRGCRCDLCQTKWRDHQREYMRQRRAMRRWAKPKTPKELIHGRITTYKRHKCRCGKCRAANAEQARARKLWALKMQTLAPEKRKPIPSPSVCPECDRNYWNIKSEKGAAYCSPYCATKAWRDKQRQRKSFAAPMPAEMRVRWETERAAEVSTAVEQNAELAALVAEQEKDARVGGYVAHRMQSLDALLSDDGSALGEIVGSDSLDPSALVIEEETAARIREVLGGRTEEDLRRLDYNTQEFLATRIRDEGLAVVPVTRAERARLRDPVRHTGGKIEHPGGYGGRTKRRQKVAANRHSRPSQKPQKRWSREDWEVFEDAA